MPRDELRAELVDLFVTTAEAHHEAFADTDGIDPDWPLWYAGALEQTLGELLGVPLSKSELVRCMLSAEEERAARFPGQEWSEAWAAHFLERCVASEVTEKPRLALYYFESCPFCSRVLRTIDRLGIEVELRDILADAGHRSDLIAARDRATVPVLRITRADGEEIWMPESAHIMQYLEQNYG